MGRGTLAAFTASAVVALLIACGSSSTDDGSSGGGDDGGSSGFGSSGSSGSSGASGTIGSSGSSGGDVDSGLNACATESQQAHLEPLSLMLMQDTSGSMWEYTSGTTSKYDAIKSALATFMADPQSAGIGLGIQFFPLFGSVPNSCAATADCGGTGGVCWLGTCSKNGAPCAVNGDCTGGGNTCVLPAKRCHDEREFICGADVTCAVRRIGNCDQPLVRGVCLNTQTGAAPLSCNTSDYATPAAAIAPLPGATAGITAQLDMHVPNGQTPTYNALQGAIQAAQAYGAAHPGEVVAVVLSTDGIPYTGMPPKCDDSVTDIEGVAAAGLAGTPSVKTFVIGVLSPTDNTAQATTTLNGIASAGGTGAATILGTSGTTEADFIAALAKIRGASLPCEFALPVPEAGMMPDYHKVNVQYTNSTTKLQTVFGYVGSVSNCDPAKGGWYYDADPDKGGTPTKVELCPASCSLAQGDPLGKVDVVQGCATQTQPPPH